jgi:hypothetical protein
LVERGVRSRLARAKVAQRLRRCSDRALCGILPRCGAGTDQLDPLWSERFPAQPEVERYLNFVADRFDLRKDIQFKTRVTAASYDEAAKRWSITTDKGETLQAQSLISCAGEPGPRGLSRKSRVNAR